MPDFIFTGPVAKTYPSLRNAAGATLQVNPGETVTLEADPQLPEFTPVELASEQGAPVAPVPAPVPAPDPTPVVTPVVEAPAAPSTDDEVSKLEAEVEELNAEVADLNSKVTPPAPVAAPAPVPPASA